MNRTLEALKVCAEKMKRRAVTRSRLIATEACRIAANSGEFIDAVRAPDRTHDRDRDAGDRGQARGVGLRLADRPQLRLDAGVRHRRRQLGADLARPGAAWDAPGAARCTTGSMCRPASPPGPRCRSAWSISPSAMAAATSRRQSYEAMVADVMARRRAVRDAASLRREDRGQARAFPRHLRHGHDHLRHPPQASGLRALARRWLLAVGARRAQRVRRSDRHDLRRARGAALHRA